METIEKPLGPMVAKSLKPLVPMVFQTKTIGTNGFQVPRLNKSKSGQIVSKKVKLAKKFNERGQTDNFCVITKVR